jgi:glycine betaine/proline transport system ATP-binding protein
MSGTKITLRNVSKIFGPHPERALRMLEQGSSKSEVQEKTGLAVGNYDVNLDIPAGKTFVLMGLSGSGKSTLLRLLNRLHETTGGVIEVDGTDITTLARRELRRFRRAKFSGMVFQRFAILPHRSVLGNVEFGLELHGLPKQERRKRAQEIIEVVGLKGWEASRPRQLSGGMQQRVGLARALALDGNILLMDEPFSALDPLIRRELQDELVELQERVRKTIVFVTHDLDEALKLGDRIAIMKDGRVQQVGSAQQIVTQPANDYVEAFVENVNRIEVLTARTLMRPLAAGDPAPLLEVAPGAKLKQVLELISEGPRGVPVHVVEQGAPVGMIERRTIFAVLSGHPVSGSALENAPRVDGSA